MIRRILWVLSILLIARGIIALIPGWTWAGETEWLGVAEIVIGVVCFALSSSQKTSI